MVATSCASWIPQRAPQRASAARTIHAHSQNSAKLAIEIAAIPFQM